MFKFNKKSVLLSLGALAILSACSGGGSTDSQNDPDKAKEGIRPAPKKEPVELAFFSNSGETEESFNDNFGNTIRKAFPHVTVKYYRAGKGFNYIEDLLLAKTTIDIVYDSVGGIPTSLLTPHLDFDHGQLIKQYNVNLNRFDPTFVKTMQNMGDGKLFGLPVNNSTMVMYYNKDIFDRFGIGYPKDGMNWDETLELAKKVTRKENGIQYRGFSMSSQHYMLMNQLSLPLVDPNTNKASINNDQWKSLYELLMKKPYEIDGNAPPKINDLIQVSYQLTTFSKDKNVAMWASLTNRQTNFTETGVNWDMVSLPTLKEAPGVGAQAYPVFFNVTTISTHKEQAFEVIEYLTSDEFQLAASRNGVMTVLTNPEIQKAYGANTDWKDKNIGASFKNKFAPAPNITKFNTVANNAYGALLLDVARGTKDVNTVLRNSEEAANKEIEKGI